jgi:5-methylcytosine-specific restriction endonuclease McrA
MNNADDKLTEKHYIWQKTEGRCWYCGEQTTPYFDFHIDHFVPKTKGGENTWYNLVPSCRFCNLLKSNLTIEEFRIKYIEKDRERAQHLGHLIEFEIQMNEQPFLFFFEKEPTLCMLE